MVAFPRRPISTSRLLIALGCVVIALILMHLGYSLPPTVDLNGKPVHHIWLDNIPRAQGDPAGSSGQFTAHMNRPPSGMIWVENTFQADVTLTINNEVVYSGPTSGGVQLASDVGDSFDVELRYHMPDASPPRARLGLMQRGLFGETYVQPAWDYQPSSLLHDLARTGMWIMFGAALVCVLAALPLTRREAAVLAAVWLLALGVQGITLAEKLQNSDAHFSMENTWDNYVTIGREWLLGREGIHGQDTQVANFIYLGILHLVLEPDFTTFYGLNAIVSSLVPPLMVLAAFALFRRWNIALLTGVFATLFMPLVHYQQTLQPEAIAHIPLALLLCAGALLYRQPRPFWALVCGALVGLCVVLRGSWLLLILWVGVILLLNRTPWRQKIAHGLLAGVALAVSMLPMIYINFSHGIYMLTPTRSDMQLFRSNGLDSLGLASYNGISEQVMFAQKGNYTDALRKDLARDPSRLIELTLRRIGLIWQSEEHSDADQVDYENYSLHMSPTTQLLSANGAFTFRTLLILALTGGVLGLRAWRRESLLLLAGAGAWMLTMIPFYSLARFRIGMAIFLLPLAALAVYEIVGLLRGLVVRRTGEINISPLRVIVIGVGLCVLNAAVLWSADWLVENMPRVQLVEENDFPTDFVSVGGVFGDQIQLLGYANYETDDAPEGYLVFELFWRALAVPTEDVIVTLRLVDTVSGEIVQTDNVRLGTNTAPQLLPTQWKTGDTLFEKYFLHLPAVTEPHSYALFVGLYSMAQDDPLLLTQAVGEALDQHVRVTAVSAWPDQTKGTQSPLATWQNALSLVQLECQIADGLQLDLTWQADQRMTQDVRLFVHVFDGDTLIAQHDQRLEPPADALPAGAQTTTSIHLADVTQTDARVQIGFYRAVDGQRLPVTFLQEGWTQADNVVTVPCEG